MSLCSIKRQLLYPDQDLDVYECAEGHVTAIMHMGQFVTPVIPCLWCGQPAKFINLGKIKLQTEETDGVWK